MIITRTRYIALLLAGLLCGPARADIAPLLQLIDYVGVDYREAVADGEVINDAEYAEMVEFGTRITSRISKLPAGPARAALVPDAAQLEAAVARRDAPQVIADITRTLRTTIMENFDITLAPRAAPELARGRELYATQCAACHGAAGDGQGPLAAGLDPPPIDFRDPVRARERSLYGLFNTITLGVDGTTMTGFGHLSDAERWALAFYVGGLFATPDMLDAGAAAWARRPVTLEQAVTLAPSELEARRRDGAALAAWLRTEPDVLFAGGEQPLAVAASHMNESLARFLEGDRDGALTYAISAYLEGFELTEAALRNISPGLMHETETAMLVYREALASGATEAEVRALHQRINAHLDEAQGLLDSGSLSPWVAFTSSFVILLREGLEAILIIGAMITFLIRTERRDAIRFVHAGWVAALAAGVATWMVSSYLFRMSGANRELTEGATALLAAAILFYVGFWMHGNASAERWGRYLKQTMHAALSRQTLWALCLVSFLAVYREAFETVLFYQALWAQTAGAAVGAIAGGGVAAAAILAVTAWLIARYGIRLPLRQFFTITAALMITLAVILSGKGVMALQEAGTLPMNPIPIPRIDILGIYPSVQAVSLQITIVLLAVALAFYQRRQPLEG